MPAPSAPTRIPTRTSCLFIASSSPGPTGPWKLAQPNLPIIQTLEQAGCHGWGGATVQKYGITAGGDYRFGLTGRPERIGTVQPYLRLITMSPLNVRTVSMALPSP